MNTVKELCRVLFPYTAVNDDELTLCEGDVVTLVSRDAPDRGWWRGEVRGRVGLFPDNFVQVLPPVSGGSTTPTPPPGAPVVIPGGRMTLATHDHRKIDVEYNRGGGCERDAAIGRIDFRRIILGIVLFLIMGANESESTRPRRCAFRASNTHTHIAVFRLFSICPRNDADGFILCGEWRACEVGPHFYLRRNKINPFMSNIDHVAANLDVGLSFDFDFAASDPEEKKPERPLSKGVSLPKTVLNKYSEKTSSLKELTTSKMTRPGLPAISGSVRRASWGRNLFLRWCVVFLASCDHPGSRLRMTPNYSGSQHTNINNNTHKDAGSENVTHKESTVTHVNKSDSEKSTHSETMVDGLQDGQGKKPPVPMKKSPTPASGVGSLLSGLKNKMLSTSDKDKSNPSLSSSTSASNSNSSGEWDRPDGGGASRPAAPSVQSNANTFDHIERNSILNDPRAGRVKAPRRRPPSQVLRDDLPQQLGLSNGQHDAAGYYKLLSLPFGRGFVRADIRG
ncbi:SH3 domain-containing kinase-binding protein 1 [Eumeta japonica]|uniref:SH3 domain-containing kinase-binding protein 1 n=1 Tax=Eumeta variegata TaxID=151549 RepID=A0A4C1Y5G9_EUMVA|nr:SH3 domain-containing kinase-binding protein 1 [Eumeta japonica]